MQKHQDLSLFIKVIKQTKNLGYLLIIINFAWLFNQNIIYAQHPLNYKYVGNKESFKFHKLTCPYALCMAKFRRNYFLYRYLAIEANYQPCKFCLPPYWVSVKADIINKNP